MGQASAETPQPSVSLWRHGDFLKLWAGETISLFGSQFTLLALPLIAAVTLQASPAEMGVLAALETAPFLLVGLFAGVWVDRRRRRPVLIVGDLGRALVLATVPLAALAGQLSMLNLYVVGFLTGLLTVFFDVAYQSYLPSLVSRDQLVEGNSKLEISRSVAQVAGPGLAGAVIRLFTAPVAIALDAVSFLVSALFLFAIRRAEDPPARASRPSMLAELREGLGVVFDNPLLRSIAGCTGTSNFFGSLVWALLILFATRELGLDAAAIGLSFGLGNLGALAGALLAGRAAAWLGVGPALVASTVLFEVGGVPLALATPASAFPLLVLSGLLIGLGSVVYNVNQVSLRQAITPHRLQGRMNATMRFIVWGTMPLGGLVGGALGEVIGLRPAIVVGVAGGFLAILWVLLSPVRSLRAVPPPADA